MRRLPPWLVFMLFVLTVILAVVAWHDRHEVGPIPVILGALWAVFTLAAAGGMFKSEAR